MGKCRFVSRFIHQILTTHGYRHLEVCALYNFIKATSTLNDVDQCNTVISKSKIIHQFSIAFVQSCLAHISENDLYEVCRGVRKLWQL